MEEFKKIIKNFKEFINSFANPIEPEKSFDELAVAAGISQTEINTLKKSMNGVNWNFAEDNEEPKRVRKNKIQLKQPEVQPVQKGKTREINIEKERD